MISDDFVKAIIIFFIDDVKNFQKTYITGSQNNFHIIKPVKLYKNRKKPLIFLLFKMQLKEATCGKSLLHGEDFKMFRSCIRKKSFSKRCL